MRRKIIITLAFMFCLVLLFVPSCPIPELETVKEELGKAVAQLPPMPQSDHIKTLTYDWGDSEGDYPPCYYARAYLIFGTQQPIEEVITSVTPSLLTLGWTVEERSYQTSRLFIRGDHERADIGYLGAGTAIAQEVEVNQLEREYKTLFTLSLDYMLPKRDQC